MNGGNAAGGEEVAHVHQSGDGQPAIDPGGTRDMRAGGGGLKVTNEEIKLHAEEDVEQDEQALHDETDALRTVGRGAADVLLLGGRRPRIAAEDVGDCVRYE